jgi:hypothetical protein
LSIIIVIVGIDILGEKIGYSSKIFSSPKNGGKIMDKQTQYRVNTPDVIYENVDNEVLIIEFNTGNYYSTNNSGGEIWELLAAGAPVSEIIQNMRAKYNAGNGDIKAAVNQLISELLEENLISPEKIEPGSASGHAAGINTSASSERLDFEPPVLQKYSDMQELLLLDPIHEVDETGWPAPKKE